MSCFYFFIVHHCKNSLPSMHFSIITVHFVHRCTLKQALNMSIYNIKVLTAQLKSAEFSHCILDEFHLCFLSPLERPRGHVIKQGQTNVANPGIVAFRPSVVHCRPSLSGS